MDGRGSIGSMAGHLGTNEVHGHNLEWAWSACLGAFLHVGAARVGVGPGMTVVWRGEHHEAGGR